MFNIARKATSSDPQSLAYTLWKCVSKSYYLSSIMSVLLSLPFVYTFVNTRWMNMTNFMLRKKSEKNEIHMIHIIGKMSS